MAAGPVNSGSTQTKTSHRDRLAVTMPCTSGILRGSFPRQNLSQRRKLQAISSFLREQTSAARDAPAKLLAKKERPPLFRFTIPCGGILSVISDRLGANSQTSVSSITREQELNRPLLASHPEASCWTPRQIFAIQHFADPERTDFRNNQPPILWAARACAQVVEVCQFQKWAQL